MDRRQSVFIIVSGVLVASFCALLFAPVSMAQQFNLSMEDGALSARGVDQATDLFGSAGVITSITNVLLFVVGALSVIMIIIGGLRYVLSGGNSANVTTAKNTILYAVVGVVIALFAYAMVNFVLTSFMPGVEGSGGTNV